MKMTITDTYPTRSLCDFVAGNRLKALWKSGGSWKSGSGGHKGGDEGGDVLHFFEVV